MDAELLVSVVVIVLSLVLFGVDLSIIACWALEEYAAGQIEVAKK